MSFARLLLIAGFAAAVSAAAFAFDKCDAVSTNPDEVIREVVESTIRQAPVKYHDLAAAIKVVPDRSGKTLIPFATEQQGTKFIVLPPLFVKVVCEMAIAEYLALGNIQPDIFERASQTAATCMDAGRSQSACLVGFADELSNRYARAYAGQSAEEQRGAVGMYTSALDQVVMHEYAHHFLGHFARIKSQKIARIDAEFEADMFAVLNAVQAGEPVSGMYYFFDGVADVERHTKRLTTPDYESGSCRASNVENITHFIGAAPIVLIDAAYGGGYSLARNSPATVRSYGQKQFAGAAPVLEHGTCGRIEKIALADAFAELKRLYLRVEQDVDFLFSQSKYFNVAQAGKLLHDLSEMSKDFRYMQGLAAKSISLIVRKWGVEGRKLTLLVGHVDLLLEAQSVAANFESEDFGRLLLAQGLAMLQERTDLSSQVRYDRASSLLQNAVYYNPGLSEAWMNLAFISLKRGDCSAAARFAEKSVATFTPTKKGDVESNKFFAEKMKELAAKPEVCKTEAADFHPYPNL